MKEKENNIYFTLHRMENRCQMIIWPPCIPAYTTTSHDRTGEHVKATKVEDSTTGACFHVWVTRTRICTNLQRKLHNPSTTSSRSQAIHARTSTCRQQPRAPGARARPAPPPSAPHLAARARSSVPCLPSPLP